MPDLFDTPARARAPRVGEWVRCERAAAAVGTWPRYAGRAGRVVQVNRTEHEYGVKFTAGGNEAPAWFLAAELIVLAGRPVGAPDVRTSAERTSAA